MSNVTCLSISDVTLIDCEVFFSEPCIKSLNDKFSVHENDISFIERSCVDDALYHLSQDGFYEIVKVIQRHMVCGDACIVTMSTDGPCLKIHHDLIVAKDAIQYSMDIPKYHSSMSERMKKILEMNLQVAGIKGGLRKANAWFNILSRSELIDDQVL